ncbi:MAG: aspartate-semialdehyde dehydrogenase [Akkermansia muciniphila]|nr:aspartate-semialdehyde dehydrogenase [Akkermansia muciniphila]MCI7004460.1 aspartate-semialdehyde dehydrogenase [Akkermansia muciniphila]MDD6814624.1 aspartate-semialdehyde dehydrogenase [Akkermansia muciniphila]
MNKPRVAIVGATGAVGVEILSCLETRNFPLASLKLLASHRSAGKQVAFRGQMLTVEELTENSFADVDIALFSAGGSISLKFAPIAAAAGAVVIDNSSAFRQEADVPLVVPEINGEAAFNHPRNIIANPNCTTIITLMALYPLHLRFGLKTIIASSYQAVSGSGQHGITELENQVRAITNGHPVEISTYPRQIAFNVLPQIDKFTESGYTKEELKMLNEGRKIMGLPELNVTCTCVRVPVYRSHSISCIAQFEKPVDPESARACYEGMPGVALMDDPANNVWPTPLDSTNGDTCYVGRIRKDLAVPNALNLWVVGDQVRKGAALNAVQIAELLTKGN